MTSALRVKPFERQDAPATRKPRAPFPSLAMTAVLGSLFTLFVLLLAAAWYVAGNRSLTIGSTTIDFNSEFLTGAWLLALFAGLATVYRNHKRAIWG